MSSLLELLFKKPLFVGAVALILGIVIGVFLGWNTVTVVDTTPAVMRSDLQEDYLRMAIDSFGVNPDRIWPCSAGKVSALRLHPPFLIFRKIPVRQIPLLSKPTAR